MKKAAICSVVILVVGCASDYAALDASRLDGTNKTTAMTNVAIGRPPTAGNVNNPADYYSGRVKAFTLAREGDWSKALPILEQLTTQYQDDGSTWYVLGLSYLQEQRWREAIAALTRVLELGTVLHNIPTGSSPSNDIMIKIAGAYSHLGDENAAVEWVRKALQARYDERPRLTGRHPFLGTLAEFEEIEASKAYQMVAGSYLNEDLSRDDAWRQDLRLLVSEIRRLHVNLYHTISPAEFQEIVAGIEERIPSLTDRQVVFEFMQLLGSVANGHNFIVPAFGAKGAFRQLPFQFYWFSDGIYIVGANEDYEEWIGSKVISFNTTPVEEALERTKRVNARDNEMQQRWLGPYYLSLPTVLEGLGIVDDSRDITLTLEGSLAATAKIRPAPAPLTFSGFPVLPAPPDVASPVYLTRQDKNYWAELIPESRTLFVQFNAVQNMASESLGDFNLRLRNKLATEQIDHLVLDLRHNSGGDGSLLPPLLATLILFEALNPEGKLFVLIGRSTFSAAHTLLVDIDRLTDAILVGEPSGSRPNAMSESGWFQLPYSGITGIVSSQFHQSGAPEDHRIWIAPHVPVSLTAAQYFAGRDPAMEAVDNIVDLARGE